MLEPREEKSITVHFIANSMVGICVIEKSITVHFIANRMVGVCVIEKSITVHFIANRMVGVCVIERIVEMSWNPEVECWNPERRNQSLYTL